jgi:hypothetical protein
MKHSLTYSLYLIFLFILQASTLCAQESLEHIWSRALNNSTPVAGLVIVNAATTDALGNVYVVGSFTNTADMDPGPGRFNLVSNGSNDIFFAKYGPAGQFIFAKSFGGSLSDVGNAIALDAQGNIFIGGGFNGTVDFDPGPGIQTLSGNQGNLDFFVAKYGPGGELIFAKADGNTNADFITGLDVDVNGNVYATGEFPGNKLFLVKYDPQGNSIFLKSDLAPTAGNQSAQKLVIDASGNICLAGSFIGSADFDPGPGDVRLTSNGASDIFFARYNSNGELIFAKSIGAGGMDIAYSLRVDDKANIYLTGTFAGTVDFDPGPQTELLNSVVASGIFFAKYDTSGNYVFAKAINGTATGNTALDLAVDGNGSIFLTGAFSQTTDFDPGPEVANLTSSGSTDVYLAQYNAQGAYVMAIKAGGTNVDGGRTIILAGERVWIGGTFIGLVDFDPGANAAFLNNSFSQSNSFLASYEKHGAYLFAGAFGGYTSVTVMNESARAIARDGSGNVYVAGIFSGIVDFDPGPATSNLISSGGTDIFFAKYTTEGQFVFAKKIGSTPFEDIWDMDIDATGNLYITGDFAGTVDFDPGTGVFNLATTSTSNYDAFFAKYDADGNILFAKKMGGTGSDLGRCIRVDTAGNIFVAGGFSNTVDFDPGPGTFNLTSAGNWDTYISKYDKNGNFLNAFKVGGVGDDLLRVLRLDVAGNIFIAGSFSGTMDVDPGPATVNLTSAGSNDVYFAKYNANGEYVFAKRLGSTGNDFLGDLWINKNNELLITGRFAGIINFDTGGGELFLESQGISSLFLAKYNDAGNVIYASSIGGSGSSTATGITVRTDDGGNVYLSGTFAGTVDTDPGPGSFSLTSFMGSTDLFVAKFNDKGERLFSVGIGGMASEATTDMEVDDAGNLLIIGTFSLEVYFDQDNNLSSLKALNGTDIFFAKYKAGSPVQGSYITAAPGNWNNPATWQGGKVPPLGAEVIVMHAISSECVCNV